MSQNTAKVLPPKFFSNPWVGFVGTIASILGLALAGYLYVTGKETRQLTYYVNPAKAVVVKAGQASKLEVNFDKKPINSDITAAQIAIWNQGRLSIKRSDILKPVVIQTEGDIPILEATIRTTSRDVTKLSLNTDDLQKGRVLLTWDILEQSDGGVIQLIYPASPNLNVYVDGVIEGQRSLSQLSPRRRNLRRTDLVFTAFWSLFFVIGATFWVGSKFKSRAALLFTLGLGLVVIYHLYLLVYADASPPFGL